MEVGWPPMCPEERNRLAPSARMRLAARSELGLGECVLRAAPAISIAAPSRSGSVARACPPGPPSRQRVATRDDGPVKRAAPTMQRLPRQKAAPAMRTACRWLGIPNSWLLPFLFLRFDLFGQ